jgi:hypothetical protein
MHSNSNLEVVGLLRSRSEGGMNSFVTEDVSVLKGRVVRGGQVLLKSQLTECVKLSLADPGNLCTEPTLKKILWKQLHLYLYKLQLVQNTAIIYTHPVH